MALIYGSLFQSSNPVHAFQLNGEGGFIPLDVNASATQQSPFGYIMIIKIEKVSNGSKTQSCLANKLKPRFVAMQVVGEF